MSTFFENLFLTICFSNLFLQTFFDNFFGIPEQSPENANSIAYIFNPYLSSSYTFGISQSSSKTINGFRGYKNIGVLKQTASMSGFQVLSTESRALNSGFIRTYGLRVDS